MDENSCYDDIRSAIRLLPEDDMMYLFDSILEALVSTMIIYHRTIGKSDHDARACAATEIKNMENLITLRLDNLGIDLKSAQLKELVIDDNPYRVESTSVEFENDMLIDLHFLMEDISKPAPKPTRKSRKKRVVKKKTVAKPE